MKIKKIKSEGLYIYPATIAAAIKDANFLKEDNIPMTQGEINLYLNKSITTCLATDLSNITEDGEQKIKEVATLGGLTEEAFEDILAYNLTLQILGAEDDSKLTQTLINNILA